MGSEGYVSIRISIGGRGEQSLNASTAGLLRVEVNTSSYTNMLTRLLSDESKQQMFERTCSPFDRLVCTKAPKYPMEETLVMISLWIYFVVEG